MRCCPLVLISSCLSALSLSLSLSLCLSPSISISDCWTTRGNWTGSSSSGNGKKRVVTELKKTYLSSILTLKKKKERLFFTQNRWTFLSCDTEQLVPCQCQPADHPTQPTTGGLQNGSSAGTCTSRMHVFARLAPIWYARSVLLNEISASELRRKFIKSMLLVGY